MLAYGPLQPFARRHVSGLLPPSGPARPVCAAKGCADGPRRLAEAACAARRLPCGARARGPAQNSLRGLRPLRSDNCAESDHEARIRARPRALRSSAPHMRAAARPHTPLLGRCPLFSPRETLRSPSRRAVPGRGDLCGGEKRRPGVGARSALRKLTRGSCPSAATEGRVASSAARPRAEHRSAVGAARRPPQHEPLPGTDRRDAPIVASETFVNVRNGPFANPRWVPRCMRRESREARWITEKRVTTPREWDRRFGHARPVCRRLAARSR